MSSTLGEICLNLLFVIAELLTWLLEGGITFVEFLVLFSIILDSFLLGLIFVEILSYLLNSARFFSGVFSFFKELYFLFGILTIFVFIPFLSGIMFNRLDGFASLSVGGKSISTLKQV